MKAKLEDNELIEIGKCISNGDKTVMEEMQCCVSDTKKYFKVHQNQYEDRGIEEEEIEEKELQWLALADSLIEHGYSCELDWKCEKEDFIWCLESLSGIQFYHLSLEEDWFQEEDSVVEWCSVLDEKWKSKKVCMAALDIDSDSYVIFPISVTDFKKLTELAEKIECRIALVKEM